MVFEEVIGFQHLPALVFALNAAGDDDVFAPDAVAFHRAPARRLQGGVDQFGAGLGFAHAGRAAVGTVFLS